MSAKDTTKDATSGVGRWPIARLLFTEHVPFLSLAVAAIAVLVLLITFAIALFAGDLTRSAWNIAMNVVRWLALGYGVYLAGDLLRVCVAHGHTRREFLGQVTTFMTVASAAVAVLLTLGYPLEALLYRAMGWRHAFGDDHLFTSADQLGLIFVSMWALVGVGVVAGAFLSAGFNRGDGSWGLFMVPLAVLLLGAVAAVIDLGQVPFLGRFLRPAELPLAGSVAVCAGSFVAGVAATWALVRDIPIKASSA